MGDNKRYYVARAMYGGWDDMSKDFLNRGVWECGDNRYVGVINGISVGGNYNISK